MPALANFFETQESPGRNAKNLSPNEFNTARDSAGDIEAGNLFSTGGRSSPSCVDANVAQGGLWLSGSVLF